MRRKSKSVVDIKTRKILRALQTHPRAKRGFGKCAVEACKKTCVMDSDYCAHHRNLRIGVIPAAVITEDANIYGS